MVRNTIIRRIFVVLCGIGVFEMFMFGVSFIATNRKLAKLSLFDRFIEINILMGECIGILIATFGTVALLIYIFTRLEKLW